MSRKINKVSWSEDSLFFLIVDKSVDNNERIWEDPSTIKCEVKLDKNSDCLIVEANGRVIHKESIDLLFRYKFYNKEKPSDS